MASSSPGLSLRNNRTVFSEPRGVRSADPGKPITSSRKDSLGFGNDLTV